ncbi:hypothetical protein CWI38_1109p0020 [Hamiltosporidium tvaerminnensis]|uniref:Uncharacterized protein n=1 Tax=Hamiltosporidium tvaerminnensis TaxID=1176355 RepID=A0A4Q9LVJ2_9MICR|nr:hypothetical protein CWI38_1109p0020 [Hamiltosporidium tvaerminnensis]
MVSKRNKIRISLGVVGSILAIFGIICVVGYIKAGNVIKSFEDDYKKFSALEDDKKFTSLVNLYKFGYFGSDKEESGFALIVKEKMESSVKMAKEALEKKNIKEFWGLFLSYCFSKEIDMDISKLEKVVGDVGLLGRLGFWFKGYHLIKPTYALSSFIHKTIKNPKKDEVKYAFLDIVDDSVVKVFDVKYDDKGPKSIPSAKKFKFEAPKNGISGKPADFIAYICYKVKKKT